MSGSIGTIKVRVGADIKDLKRGLYRATSNLNKFSRATGSIASQINNNISIPFALASVAGVKLATELEANFSKIQNLVGITGKTLEQFKEGVKGLSTEVGKSQAELSSALFTVTSAGLRGAEAMEVLESASKASVIGLGQTDQVARALTGVMQSYGVETYNAARATDVLTAIVREGNLEAESLAPVLGRVTGLAATMGISFEEVGASIATFTRLGVSAEEAVTALRGVMTNFLNPSQQAKKEIESLGLSVEDLQAKIRNDGLAKTLIDLVKQYKGNESALGRLIPNVRALSGVLGTAGAQADQYSNILQNVYDSTGLVEEGFANAAETAQFKFNQAITDVTNAGIELGAAMLPIATDLAESVSKAAQAFAALDEETQKTITSIGLYAVAVGGGFKATSLIAGGLGGLTQTFNFFVPAVGKAGVALTAFDKALNATKIGLLLAGIGTAIYLYKKFKDAANQANHALEAQNYVSEESSKLLKHEKKRVEDLIAVVKDNTQAYHDRISAISELKSIHPEYFNDLTIEKDRVEGLNEAYSKFQKDITKKVSTDVAKKKLAELREQHKALLKELGRVPKSEGYLLRQLKDINAQIREFELLAKDFPQWQKDLIADQNLSQGELASALLGLDASSMREQREKAKKLQKEMEMILSPNGQDSSSNSSGTSDQEKRQKIIAKLNQELRSANELYKIHENVQQLTEDRTRSLNRAIEELINTGLSATSKPVQQLVSDIAETNAMFKKVSTSRAVSELEKLDSAASGIDTQIEYEINVPSTEEIEAKLPELETDYEINVKFNEDTATQFGSIMQGVLNSLSESGIQIGADLAESLIQGAEAGAMALTALDGLTTALRAKRQAELDEDFEREKERIEGTINNETDKAAALEQLESKYAKKKKEIQRDAAIREKAGAIAQSIINTAVAVTKALGVSPILAAIVGSLGAAQTAVIASTPLGFAKGGDVAKAVGKVRGVTNAPARNDGDHILAYLKYGEAVLNPKQIQAIGPEVLAAARVPGFSLGGSVGPPPAFSPGVSSFPERSTNIRLEFGPARFLGEEILFYIEKQLSIRERERGF